ncbi:MAG TPA: prepilin-type N-terminal cleavage/methylation domain-containing protein [Candidatus Kryptonia bacterium]|nr:prepilin-type N-terminal cleavage/methylation domain-containing protein [Candidatus Kryptonia bacterium]
MTTRGYSLMECMVAVVLIGVIATAVAQTIVTTQRGRQLSENWMRATELAAQRIEAVRARPAPDDQPTNGIFLRDTALAPIADHPGLARLDVTVTWADPQPHSLTLSTMVPR